MDVSHDGLKDEYKKLILKSVSEPERFRTRCLRFLDGHHTTDCFKLLPFNDIRKDFLKKPKQDDAEFEHLVKVFQQFEKYATSILAKPWCKDLHSIKVYTGFFKYNFEQWLSLKIVYDVFGLIGYKERSSNILTLQGPVNEDRVLVIGFELYLAHTQLHVLKCNEDLTSKYSMKSIVEGWLSTTGNAVNIREWLGKNKSTIESGFMKRTPSSCSSTDIPEETPRSNSVTVEAEPLHYDRNGVRYPPDRNLDENKEFLDLQAKSQGCQNEQHDYSANSGFPSLRTVSYPDNELYGDDDGDGDHAVSPPPMSESNYVYFDRTALASIPRAFNNKLHAHLQHECGDNMEMTTDAMRRASSEKHVVARGGNSEHGSSHFYENTTTVGKDILAGKERADQILSTRMAQAEKIKQNVLNRNSTPSIIQGDYKTHKEVEGERVRYKEDFEHKMTDGKLLGLGPFDATNNFQGMDPGLFCNFCGNPSDYECRKCEEFVCNECFQRVFQKRPCRENEHELYCIKSTPV
ncbi:Hypothetical predicted protein [Paramuricea clavata]|uniref:Spermatogenesis-associated protein 2 PUB-like domain-containing protein n=1 Tax=Paramuricea clavata TaxID=317549 RepID=A0A7D9HR01_PARCT|nr:Hypothetical predicted protein [Paramuricea clavata]